MFWAYYITRGLCDYDRERKSSACNNWPSSVVARSAGWSWQSMHNINEVLFKVRNILKSTLELVSVFDNTTLLFHHKFSNINICSIFPHLRKCFIENWDSTNCKSVELASDGSKYHRAKATDWFCFNSVFVPAPRATFAWALTCSCCNFKIVSSSR